MRIVTVLLVGALVVGLAAGQKHKDEPEYDDDYDYDNEAPVKDSGSSSKKDTPNSPKDTNNRGKDSAKGTDEAANEDTQPKKKLEHPTSIFLKPRNTRVHNKVTPAPLQRARPTLPSFIKHPATGAQVSTTVTPRSPGGARIERSTAAPIKSRSSNSRTTTTTTTQRPKRGGSSSSSNLGSSLSSSSNNKKSSRATEAPAKESGRRFGGSSSSSSKLKNSKSSRFSNKDN